MDRGHNMIQLTRRVTEQTHLELNNTEACDISGSLDVRVLGNQDQLHPPRPPL